jgi:hypothetical protein
MEEAKLICPLSMANDFDSHADCQKQKCAWWISKDDVECCSIKRIALSLARKE